MRKILNEKKYLCRIATSGPIQELGCVTGPIRRCKLNEKQIFQLVKNDKAVYEVNPFNTAEEVLLTAKNMATRHFVKPLVNPIKQMEEEKENISNIITGGKVSDSEAMEEIPDVVEESVEITKETEEPAVVEAEEEVTESESETVVETDEVEGTTEETTAEEKPQYQIRNNKHGKNRNKNR